MRTTTRGILVATCFGLGAVVTSPAEAADACKSTGKAVIDACKDDANADRSIALGYCFNLPTKETKKACRAAAKASFAEAKEECSDQLDGRKAFCEAVGKDPYDPQINPANFLSPAATAAAPNPYFPLVVGTVRTYQKGTETIVVTVTDKTKVIQGVTTIVVHDVVSEGGQPVEDTDDYYAQHTDGTVWYFGELSRDFEDGDIVSIDGSFRAGVDGAKAGIIMLAAPAVGTVYRQEFALDEAEDAAEVLSITGTETVPGGSCSGTCVVTRDFNLLDPGHEETKYYAPGIGLILEISSETGARTELQSVTP
ncbi:MAG: hypothetical protein ABIR79_10410 [Candidatus Binatia bacterium]